MIASLEKPSEMNSVIVAAYSAFACISFAVADASRVYLL